MIPDFISPLSFYEVTFAHSDCDAVCNLLFACNFVMLYMTVCIDCAMSDS